MYDNYNPIRQLNDELLREYYSDIEKDLEEIINAPSLLARTSKYYRLYHDVDSDIVYLFFIYDGEIWIVKVWTINKFQEYMRTK